MEYTRAKLHIAKGDITKEWYAYWFEKDPATGKMLMCKQRSQINYIKDKKRRKSEGVMLVQELNKLLSEGWRKHTIKHEVLPVKQVLKNFLEIKKTSLRRRTWQSYEYSMNTFFAWMDERKMIDYRPEHITKAIALQYCDYLAGTKKYKGKTFNGHKANLGTMFNMMVEREIIDKNPFSKIAKQPEEDGSHIAFNAAQKEKLKKHLQEKNPDLLLFVKFIYHCFIRPIELLRIKVGDMNLESKTIIVYGGSSKNKRTMPVAIPDSFIEDLKAIDWSKYAPTDYLFGRKLRPGPLSLSRNRVSFIHSEVLTDLKFTKGYTMYGWKHTGNVDAYNAGVDVYSLMRQNRHHSLEQTIKYLRGLGLSPNVEFSTKKPPL